MNFPAVNIRTSIERPEAIDHGVITIGYINPDSILQATEIAIKSFKESELELPEAYKVNNTSDRVIKIVQGYTSIVNTEVWKK